jgi:hypothetical protein
MNGVTREVEIVHLHAKQLQDGSRSSVKEERWWD